MSVGREAGQSFPLGASVRVEGVNFSLYSRRAHGVELLLFDTVDAREPSRVIELEFGANRTFYYWHTFVPGLRPGQLYGFRVHGPFDPERGLRFDPQKVLLDPYGKGVALPCAYSRAAAAAPGDNGASCAKSVIADPTSYDWEDDRPLRRPFSRSVIYEMHVAGFTRHPSSGVPEARRGMFVGLIDKLPYLVDLGITAVELLPVFQFDATDAPPRLSNYWGYSPMSFFAPHSGYSTRRDPLAPLDEFRAMVKALHRAGIEVILDVVYNHTCEGSESGPTLCFRGLENETYYILDQPRAAYANYSGCGNTLNANHVIVRRLIIDSLRYWVEAMHVDGFRFDLASVLSRDERGDFVPNPPILWEIESDPFLVGAKLIAEAWDAAGLYQVGSFIGDRWMEWNGKFRDDVRCFWRGDPCMVSKVASRLLASPDLYGHKDREPEQSVNFVTCHDGFTLNDLVSYSRKHNQANREDNRDGTDENHSWNCGTEGPSEDPTIERLRNRQVKNLLASTILALGVPMLLMGDEVRRTQRGNNNAWCQDNDVSWFDWSLLDRHADLRAFVKRLIHFRLNLDVVRDRRVSLAQVVERAQVQWHGVRLGAPDWSDDSHTLAVNVRALARGQVFQLILNAYWEALTFELPPVTDHAASPWRRIIDTAASAPGDCCAFEDAEAVGPSSLLVPPRSLVLLESRFEHA